MAAFPVGARLRSDYARRDSIPAGAAPAPRTSHPAPRTADVPLLYSGVTPVFSFMRDITFAVVLLRASSADIPCIFIRRKDFENAPTDLASRTASLRRASASSRLQHPDCHRQRVRLPDREHGAVALDLLWACPCPARTCSVEHRRPCRPGTHPAPASVITSRARGSRLLVAMNPETAKEDVLTLSPAPRSSTTSAEAQPSCA